MVPSGLESGGLSAGPAEPRPGHPGELYYNVSSNSMGKRELLLVLGFALAGVIVYHAAAPPPAPGERSFSFSGIIEHFHRAMRGSRASAEVTSTTHHAVPPGVSVVRLSSRLGAVTILGEDRQDIEAEIRVRSNGADEAEARQLAGATHLDVQSTDEAAAGAALAAHVEYPAAGTQRTLRLSLKVPARLRIVLEAPASPLSVTGVAGLELRASRGETHIRDIAGPVTGTHRGGDLFIAGCQEVTLEASGADLQIERVGGKAAVNVRGGSLRGREIGGAVQVTAQASDVTLEQLQTSAALVRVTAAAGSVTIRQLGAEAQLDVRNTDVQIDAVRPVPLTIRSEGGGSIDVTPAPGGYQLDALTAGGDLTLPDGAPAITTAGQEHRALGPVGGGGPALLLRTTRADITVHAR